MNRHFLLCHPPIEIDEGPNAYLQRLAEANQVYVKDLKGLGIGFAAESSSLKIGGPIKAAEEATEHVLRLQELLAKWPAIWNLTACRFCPRCLAGGSVWKAEWELLFFDACPIHKCWLVDQCDGCSETLTWSRSRLNRCNCGHRFAQSTFSDTPGPVVLLSKAMACRLATDFGISDAAPIQNLNLEKIIRLVRFLGAYGQTVSELSLIHI